MIGFLKGRLIDKQPPYLMLEVHGVGYELEAPMTTFYELPDIGAEVQLYTHLVVRDDAHLLYAFIDPQDRALFRQLLKVSGVGGKLALNILSRMNAAQFQFCIQNEDSSSLVKLPGVGKKTAQRLILELKDRWQNSPALTSAPQAADHKQDAIQALIALGYKPAEASQRVNAVYQQDHSIEDLIKAALQ